MKAKKILTLSLLLAVAIILAACGTTDSVDPTTGSSEGVVKDEVTAVLERMDSNLYRYTVNNQTDESMSFDFTSGQRFDFTISNGAGKELYRLSSLSMYTQALGEETIEPGGSLEYEFEVPSADFEAGDYLLTAWLTPQDGPQFEEEIEITIE